MKIILTILLLFPLTVFSQYIPKSPFEDAIRLNEQNVLKNLSENDTLILINNSFGCFHSDNDTFSIFKKQDKYWIQARELDMNASWVEMNDPDYELPIILKNKVLSELMVEIIGNAEANLIKPKDYGNKIIVFNELGHTAFYLKRKKTIYFMGYAQYKMEFEN